MANHLFSPKAVMLTLDMSNLSTKSLGAIAGSFPSRISEMMRKPFKHSVVQRILKSDQRWKIVD
jgi:hypothetical protein